MDAASWFEIRVNVPLSKAAAMDPQLAEVELGPLSGAALTVSPGGFVMEGADAPPGDLPVPAKGTVRARVYALAPEVEAGEATLRAALGLLPRGADAVVERVPLDDGWQDRWKEWFHGFVVSERLAVRPPWEDEPEDAPPGRRTVVIEPGMAFGTGQHATTRLCLETLDRMHGAGAGLPSRVLDVGCGTGILSVAWALLRGDAGGEAVGVDVDAHAVALAQSIVDANGVADRVSLSTTPVDRVEGTFPLVLANILAHILDAIADGVVARVAPGGTLLLSGLIREQEAPLRARYEALGLELVERRDADTEDWVLLIMRRPEAG